MLTEFLTDTKVAAWLWLTLSCSTLFAVRLILARRVSRPDDYSGTRAFTPVEFAEMTIARYRLSTCVAVGGRQNKFDPKTDTVHLTHDVANRRDSRAYATVSHELGHAIRFHDRRLLTVLYAKLGLWAPAAALTVAALSLAARVFDVEALVYLSKWTGTAALQAAASSVTLGISTTAATTLFAIVASDEWRTSFPLALTLMEQAGVFSEDDIVICRSSLKAAATTYLLPFSILPAFVIALWPL
ncbi:Zn-dependent membrane protease YugP [Azospirillum sp. OGB3]|uniref:zinc metallopeptidase n=1 Tax=Azospirillum sp. OGB3 TaxID=2587012 RepID=UPI0016062B54|nr:zinc metallopeptidase [Azospirillum sp. OGB3]MBB3267774.1 Zn-dependent membrane protease YugP [Azospirillum sp. OGB3]